MAAAAPMAEITQVGTRGRAGARSVNRMGPPPLLACPVPPRALLVKRARARSARPRAIDARRNHSG